MVGNTKFLGRTPIFWQKNSVSLEEHVLLQENANVLQERANAFFNI